MFKTLALSTLFLSCLNIAGAQKIYFGDSTNKWSVVRSSCGGDDHLPYLTDVYYLGDTIVNGYSYRIMSPYNVFVREDTVNNKVFAFAPDWPSYDTTEELLYDYNLQVGDTFICKVDTHVVIGIDSVTIGVLSYRVWHLASVTPMNEFVDYDVVEGVGCTNMPIYPLYPYFFEECVFEYCFENNGTNTPFSHSLGTLFWEYYHLGLQGVMHYDNTTSCNESFGLDLNEVHHHGGTILVTPNPVRDDGKIMLPYAVVAGELIISDQLGQVVRRITFSNKNELIFDRPGPAGLYYFRVLDNKEGTWLAGKFLLQ